MPEFSTFTKRVSFASGLLILCTASSIAGFFFEHSETIAATSEQIEQGEVG